MLKRNSFLRRLCGTLMITLLKWKALMPRLSLLQ